MQEPTSNKCDPGGQSTPFYSPALQPLMQALLATLANLDFEYEEARKKASFTSDINLRIRVLERLKENHRVRREPYVQQLARLQVRTQSGRT